MPLPACLPMLASAGFVPAHSRAWAVEPKLDGWRVLAYVDGTLDVRTRNGSAIADRLPELAGLPAALGGRPAVLDGELVVGQGQPADFYALAPRLAATRPAALRRWRPAAPVTLAVFDVLHLDGVDLRGRPYGERRGVLESLGLTSPAWCTVASYRTSPTVILDACTELGLEGVVVKRLSSRYQAGRSRDWVKVKTPDWREHHAPCRHEEPRSG